MPVPVHPTHWLISTQVRPLRRRRVARRRRPPRRRAPLRPRLRRPPGPRARRRRRQEEGPGTRDVPLHDVPPAPARRAPGLKGRHQARLPLQGRGLGPPERDADRRLPGRRVVARVLRPATPSSLLRGTIASMAWNHDAAEETQLRGRRRVDGVDFHPGPSPNRAPTSAAPSSARATTCAAPAGAP